MLGKTGAKDGAEPSPSRAEQTRSLQCQFRLDEVRPTSTASNFLRSDPSPSCSNAISAVDCAIFGPVARPSMRAAHRERLVKQTVRCAAWPIAPSSSLRRPTRQRPSRCRDRRRSQRCSEVPSRAQPPRRAFRRCLNRRTPLPIREGPRNREFPMVIDSYHDDPAVIGQIGEVVERPGCRSRCSFLHRGARPALAASISPLRRRPHVQNQAVLAHRWLGPQDAHHLLDLDGHGRPGHLLDGHLWTRGAVGQGIHALPAMVAEADAGRNRFSPPVSSP